MRPEKCTDLLFSVERVAVQMKFSEQCRVQLIEFAQRLGRIKHPRMHAQGVIPDRWNAYEINVSRLLFSTPRLDQGIKRIAMAAAIPEEFGDLYMTWCSARGLRRHQFLVMRALLEL